MVSLGLWVLVKKKGTAGEEEEKGGGERRKSGLTSWGEVKEMKGWRLQSGTARALGWNRCGISLRDSPSVATASTLPTLCNTSWFLCGSRKERVQVQTACSASSISALNTAYRLRIFFFNKQLWVCSHVTVMVTVEGRVNKTMVTQDPLAYAGREGDTFFYLIVWQKPLCSCLHSIVGLDAKMSQ